MVYGLWQNESQVTSGLEKLSSTSEKLKALKCQLDFRNKVLEQGDPKEVFFMTKNRKKLTVDEVAGKLSTLFSPAHRPVASSSLLLKKVWWGDESATSGEIAMDLNICTMVKS